MEIFGINNQSSGHKAYTSFKNKQSNKDFNQDDNSPASENLVSSNVKKLNDYYTGFEASKNILSQEGVNIVIHTFADDQDAMTKFILTSEELKNTDRSSFNNLFELIGNIQKKGLNPQKWLKTFNSLDSIQLKNDFITSTSRLINENTDKEELESLYNGFLNKIISIQFDRNLSKAQKNIHLDSYFISITTFKGPLNMSEIEKTVNDSVTKQASI